jgi:Tol biopolymer transport system component
MNDLHDRFRSLDDLSTPDLWREAEARAQALPQPGFRTVPWVLIALALLLALAIGGAALIGSGFIKLPVVIEVSATPTSSPPVEPATGRIAFGRVDRFVGDYVVYLIDPDGTNERQLLPGGYECARWSPDGQDISLGSGIFKNAGQPNGSFRAFTTFSPPTRYLPDPTLSLGCAVWSPDGKRLAYEGWDDTDPTRNGIYTLNATDGSDLQRLTSNPDGGRDSPGDYSADGSRLFFARDHGCPRNRFACWGPLMVVGMDGSDPRQVTSGAYGVPSLSPDGQTLVASTSNVGGKLYLIAVDGSSETPITIPDATSIHDFGPSWSPDGSWIVFPMQSDTFQAWAIARVRPDGSGLFQLTDSAADAAFPDWAP